jgi:hypothetical protein
MPRSLQTSFDTREEAYSALPDWLGHYQPVNISSQWVFDWEAIGSLVRKRRMNTGMSLRSMAKWMSISATYLSDLERGLRPWPLERLHDASSVLDMAERKQSE